MLSMEVTRLIERCRQGDTDALGELYKAYAQKMRGVCRRYVSDEQAVSDVLHDAFVIIFTSFDKLRDDGKAEAWMMSITRNVASKYKEHLSKMNVVRLEEVEHLQVPEEGSEGRSMPWEDVLQLVDRLPEGYGQVFRLSVFEGMSHKEIAAMLGIEPHSSSSQLARAKKMLRKMMQQYWAAVLLLLLMPLTFFLLKKDDTAVTHDQPTVAKHEESEDDHLSLPEAPAKRQPAASVISERHSVALPSLTAQAVDSVTVDSLSNTVAQQPAVTDTVSSDTTKTIYQEKWPQYDLAGLLPEQPTASTDNGRKWSLQLAYAVPLDEQNRYDQPFSFKPVPSDVQALPSGIDPAVPGSIDHWSDYAAYLANNPGAVSDKTRSVIMRIALNNANRPGDDRILRKSHHRMPVTWSLALKYRLDHRFGLESGLGYSRLTSDFEMGTDGNVIREQQTIHYLGIPMKAIYNMYDGKRWGAYGSLGLTTSIPVYATLQSDFYVSGKPEAGDKTTIRVPWQFSTTLGVGLQLHLTPSIGFFAEPSLQYDIPMKSDIETYRTEHPFTFSLPLGIRFTW